MSRSPRSTTIGGLVEEGVLAFSDGYRTKRSELGDGGLPILRVAEVAHGWITPSTGDHVRSEFRPKMGIKTSRAGDVLVTTKGTVGRVAIVPDGFPEHVYSPQLCFFRVVDHEVVDPSWLYCWARSPEFARQAVRLQDQTDMAPYLSLTDLRRFEISLPPLEVQRGIAGVVGALDDLIDTNQRLAYRLDEQVRLVGRRFIDSVAGHSSSVPMMQIADIDKGYSYKSTELVEGGGQWLVNLKNVGRDGAFQERGFKPLAGNPKEKHLVDHGDVVVAQTDLTQARDVIARPVRVRRFGLVGEMVASLDLVRVRPRPGLTAEFIYAVLDHPEFRSHALGYCNGTTVLHMAAKAIPDHFAPLPDEGMIADFTETVRPLRSAADELLDEIALLRRTRDELLPLLLSGRVLPGEVAV